MTTRSMPSASPMAPLSTLITSNAHRRRRSVAYAGLVGRACGSWAKNPAKRDAARDDPNLHLSSVAFQRVEVLRHEGLQPAVRPAYRPDGVTSAADQITHLRSRAPTSRDRRRRAARLGLEWPRRRTGRLQSFARPRRAVERVASPARHDGALTGRRISHTERVMRE